MKSKPVILIVDDQSQNIELLEAQLASENYELMTASSGKEALEKISGNRIDLMLLDVMMPNMNGFEVTQQVRQDKVNCQLPIVLVTSLRETEHRVRGIEAGCDDFISKPIDKMELLARIRSLLKVKAYNDLLANYRNELEAEVLKRTEELNQMTVMLKESNLAIRRFIPEQFLTQLGKTSIEMVKLGDFIAVNMVIMFADIREFSALSEKMSPEETFAFINQYLAKLGPSVRKHGGFIDKYIGDAIMALFPSSPDDAVRCAIEMHGLLVEFNAQRVSEGKSPIKIGIGLHEGKLMLGTVGENERMDGTVISDSVNTASRIEGISKQFNIGLAVSEKFLLALKDTSAYHIRFIGKIAVKGRHDEVSIFEIYDGDPESLIKKKDAIKSSFEHGLSAFYTEKFTQAADFFNTVLEELPDDFASFHYIRIIRRLLLS